MLCQQILGGPTAGVDVGRRGGAGAPDGEGVNECSPCGPHGFHTAVDCPKAPQRSVRKPMGESLPTDVGDRCVVVNQKIRSVSVTRLYLTYGGESDDGKSGLRNGYRAFRTGLSTDVRTLHGGMIPGRSLQTRRNGEGVRVRLDLSPGGCDDFFRIPARVCSEGVLDCFRDCLALGLVEAREG